MLDTPRPADRDPDFSGGAIFWPVAIWVVVILVALAVRAVL